MSFQRFYQPYFKTHSEHEKLERMNSGLEYGYYLVLPESSKTASKRFYISKVVDVPLLEKLCSKLVLEGFGDMLDNYWIDKSLGTDVDGNPAWVNTDQSYKFL